MAETCPKCDYARVETDTCPRCRVIVSQYRANLLHPREKGFSALVGRIRKAVSPASQISDPPGRQGHLKCPRCSTRLDKLDADEGIAVHRCEGCSGTWHEKGILDEFSRHAFSEFLQEKPVLSQYPSDLRCPRCELPMEKSGLGAGEFPVGRCRSCRGLWLDLGQIPQVSAAERAKLDEIVARVRALAAPTPRWVSWVAMFLLLAVAGWLVFEEALEKVFLIRLILVLLVWLVPTGWGWFLWRAWKTGELSVSDLKVKKSDEPVRFWVDFLFGVFLLAVFFVISIFGVACVLLGDC